jgi:hypothetical protein
VAGGPLHQRCGRAVTRCRQQAGQGGPQPVRRGLDGPQPHDQPHTHKPHHTAQQLGARQPVVAQPGGGQAGKQHGRGVDQGQVARRQLQCCPGIEQKGYGHCQQPQAQQGGPAAPWPMLAQHPHQHAQRSRGHGHPQTGQHPWPQHGAGHPNEQKRRPPQCRQTHQLEKMCVLHVFDCPGCAAGGVRVGDMAHAATDNSAVATNRVRTT